ncbi:stress response small protein YobI, partial [Escherichia coli]
SFFTEYVILKYLLPI